MYRFCTCRSHVVLTKEYFRGFGDTINSTKDRRYRFYCFIFHHTVNLNVFFFFAGVIINYIVVNLKPGQMVIQI